MKASENVDWEAARKLFEWDGSWRDLYIFGTTAQDWDRLVEALGCSSYCLEFSCGGDPAPLPSSFAAHFSAGADRLNILLSIVIGEVRINAHMFCEEEIEFDIDPREISGPAGFAVLVEFMNFAADALGREVVLTAENGPEYPLLVARPGSAGVSQPSRPPR